jgi:hypothetical protein
VKCRKCGSENVRTKFIKIPHYIICYVTGCRPSGWEEKLEHVCECGYSWLTDCLDKANAVCDGERGERERGSESE